MKPMVALAAPAPNLLNDCLALYQTLEFTARRRVDELCDAFLETNGRKDPRQFPTFSFVQLLLDASGLGINVNDQFLTQLGPHDLGFTRPQAFTGENGGLEDVEFMAQSFVAHSDVGPRAMQVLNRSKSAIESWRKFAKSPPVEIVDVLVERGCLLPSLSNACSPAAESLQKLIFSKAPALDRYLDYRRLLLSLVRPTPLRTKAAHIRLHRSLNTDELIGWPAFKLIVPAQAIQSHEAGVYLEDFISHLSASFHCVWSDYDLRVRYPFTNGGNPVALNDESCTALLVGKHANLFECGTAKVGELLESYRFQHNVSIPTDVFGRRLPVQVSKLVRVQDLYPPVPGWNLSILRPYCGGGVFGDIPADKQFLERIVAAFGQRFSTSSRQTSSRAVSAPVNLLLNASASTTTSAY
jgi:hypothetical protein